MAAISAAAIKPRRGGDTYSVSLEISDLADKMCDQSTFSVVRIHPGGAEEYLCDYSKAFDRGNATHIRRSRIDELRV
jgi:hypothetical protein